MAADILQSTAQNFLDIYDITNNLVICKDGTTSIILTVDAMNFGLLAEEEQDAIMYAYAGLLNSLNYPIQIIIRSQTKDVTTYLKLLEEQELTAISEIMQRRIRLYREFVSNLIRERNVLDKKFYVVIPASPLELGLLASSSVIPGKQTFDVSSVEKSVLIEKALTILEPKRDHLISQFARIGLFSRQVATQEIIQLFYLSYNPEATEGQNIDDSTSYTTPLVQPDTIRNISQVQLPPTRPSVAALQDQSSNQVTQPSPIAGQGQQPDNAFVQAMTYDTPVVATAIPVVPQATAVTPISNVQESPFDSTNPESQITDEQRQTSSMISRIKDKNIQAPSTSPFIATAHQFTPEDQPTQIPTEVVSAPIAQSQTIDINQQPRGDLPPLPDIA